MGLWLERERERLGVPREALDELRALAPPAAVCAGRKARVGKDGERLKRHRSGRRCRTRLQGALNGAAHRPGTAAARRGDGIPTAYAGEGAAVLQLLVEIAQGAEGTPTLAGDVGGHGGPRTGAGRESRGALARAQPARTAVQGLDLLVVGCAQAAMGMLSAVVLAMTAESHVEFRSSGYRKRRRCVILVGRAPRDDRLGAGGGADSVRDDGPGGARAAPECGRRTGFVAAGENRQGSTGAPLPERRDGSSGHRRPACGNNAA